MSNVAPAVVPNELSGAEQDVLHALQRTFPRIRAGEWIDHRHIMLALKDLGRNTPYCLAGIDGLIGRNFFKTVQNGLALEATPVGLSHFQST